MEYSCETIHVALCDLETLADGIHAPGSEKWHQQADSLPVPFKALARIRSATRLGPITLGEAHDMPHLSVVRQPSSILFKSLNGGAMATLAPNDIPATGGRVRVTAFLYTLTFTQHDFALAAQDHEYAFINRTESCPCCSKS